MERGQEEAAGSDDSPLIAASLRGSGWAGYIQGFGSKFEGNFRFQKSFQKFVEFGPEILRAQTVYVIERERGDGESPFKRHSGKLPTDPGKRISEDH